MAAPLTEEEIDALISTPPPKAQVEPSQADPETSENEHLLVNERGPVTVTPENVDMFLGDIEGPKPNKPSMVGDVLRGIDNLQSTGAGLVELIGNASGWNSVEEWGSNVRALNEAEAQRNPAAIGSYTNVHGWGDAARYAVEGVLENLPMFVPSMVSGGVGGLIARKTAEGFVEKVIAEQVAKGLSVQAAKEAAAKMVAKRVFLGSVSGAYLSSSAMETGDIYGSVIDDSGVHAPLLAVGAGSLAGLFDALPEGKLISNIITPKVAGQLEKHLITRLGVEGAKQFLREAPTEAIQTIIEQGAQVAANPSQDLFSDGRIDEYIDAGLKGGFAGFFMGSSVEGVRSFLNPHPNDQVRDKERKLDEAAGEQAPPVEPVEVEVSEADKQIEALHQQVSALEEEEALPETTEERKAEIATEKAALITQAEEISKAAEAALVNENEQPSVAQRKSLDDVTVDNINEIVQNGGGVVRVSYKGQPVDFESFSVGIEGNDAEVVKVKLAQRDESTKGLGTLAYIRLGNALQVRGIRLRSSNAQYADGRALWDRLVSMGHAERLSSGQYAWKAGMNIAEEAKKHGAIYQGYEGGLHAFKEESTGGNFSIPNVDLTSEKIAEKAKEVWERFPTYTPSQAALPSRVTPQLVSQTRERVSKAVGSLVNEKSEGAKEYSEAVRDALEPHLNFLAGEDIQVRRAKRGDSYEVHALPDGGIEIRVPSQTEWNARNKRQAKSGGLIDTLSFKRKLVDHEVIHAAYYAHLREKWNKGGKKGPFSDYVVKQISKVGKSVSANVPQEVGAIYQPGRGATDEFTTGTEFMRMIVERARAGQLTEDVQIALNARHRGGVTTFLKTLIEAAKAVRSSIQKFINPNSSTKEVQSAYNGINTMLDKYGNLQLSRVPPLETPITESPSLVNENEAPAEKPKVKTESVKPAPETYQEAVKAAREDDSLVEEAAIMHARVRIGKGEKLGTAASRDVARSMFETSLQKPVDQELYDRAVKKARKKGPISRRGPESEGDEVVTAYHATPYEVDRFSNDKARSGLGRVAYGHGMNFSASRDISGVGGEYYQKVKKLFGKARSYTVQLALNSGRMLDWNKPINEHPEPARSIMLSELRSQVLGRVIDRNINRGIEDGTITAGQAYRALASVQFGPNSENSEKAVSERLVSLGIIGSRYIDGEREAKITDSENKVRSAQDEVDSLEKRIARESSHRLPVVALRNRLVKAKENLENRNRDLQSAQSAPSDYTIFDDKRIKITHENDIPRLVNEKSNETTYSALNGNDNARVAANDTSANLSDEARPNAVTGPEGNNGTEFTRGFTEALDSGDIAAASELIQTSGSENLHTQFIDDPLEQVDRSLDQLSREDSLGMLVPSVPIRGNEVARSLRFEPHRFAPGKRDVSFRPEDDWFAENVHGMEFVVPSRWKGTENGPRIIDWAGDFSDSAKFQDRTNKGASMRSPVTIADKLKEANHTTGAPRSLDIVGHFGVREITPETVEAFDQEFGENRWIVKPKNDAHSRNVMFPEALKAMGSLVNENLTGRLMVQERFQPLTVQASQSTDSNIAQIQANQPSMARVHVVTNFDGTVHVVPFATIDYGTENKFENDISEHENVVYETPVIFTDDRIRGFESAAQIAIESLPLSDRSGSMFSVEVIQTPDGFKIIELNPNFSQYAENGRGGGGHLQNNYAVQDAVLSAMKGELPLHARIARAALEQQSAVSRRSPEMQEVEGEAHAALDRMFNPNVLVNERERRIQVGSRLSFGGFTPMELEVMSQPKEPSFFAAKEFFDTNGSVIDNAEFLLRNPEVHGTGLVGSERTALYKIVMIGLDHIRTSLDENFENFDAEDSDSIHQMLDALDIQYGQFGTEVGRIASSMKDLTPFINGRKSVKEYTKSVIQQWKKRFGQNGMAVLDTLSARLNAMSAKAMSGIVTRAEFVAGMRKILRDLGNKKWRKAMRQTLVNESAKMNGIAGQAASRAAEIEFGNLDNEPALKEAARRILNDMTFGIPKQTNSEDAATILSQAISEVTRDAARMARIIPERPKRVKVTELEKLSAIIQNEELYEEFILNLEERMHTKFGGENAQANFHEDINRFVGQMRAQSWRQGLLERVVAEQSKKLKVFIAKAARESVGAGRDAIEQIKEAVASELASLGLDEDAISSVAEDVDSMLNQAADRAREVWAGKPGAVAKTLREMGQTVNRIARQGFVSRERATSEMAATFIDRLGLANTAEFPHAQMLSRIIQRTMGEMVDAERKKIVDSIIKNADPAVQAAAKARGASGRRTAIDRIIEMANVGALTNEKVYGALAEKLGLPRYSPTDALAIQEWGERIGDMLDGREKTAEIHRLRDFIESRKGVTWKQMAIAGMYASMLSGPSTQLVNGVSNTLNLMGEVWTQSWLHPDRIPAIMRAMFVGLSRGQIELRETLASGIGNKLNQKIEGGNPLEYVNPVYLDRVAENLGGLLSLTRAKYVVRLLQGVDMMFYKAAQEVSLAANTGYDGSGDNWATHLTTARAGLIAEGREVDTSGGRRAVELRALETMERQRIENDPELARAWNEAHGEALTTTFNQEPKGWVGRLALMIGKYTGEFPSGKLLVPFTRVVANVLNAQIEWSPFGTLRWAFSKDFRIEDVDGNMVRDPKILVRSLTSMLALGALTALLAKYGDDDDPFFTIYGSGPKDADKKRQMYEQGWKPNTIKVGGTYFSYLTTPMSLSMASIGTLMDRHREGSDINPLSTVPQLGIAFVQGTLNQSFLSGVADLFSAFESPNPEKGVQRFLARTVTMPIPNLIKQIDAWVDPSVQQTEGFLDTVIKQVPVARHSLKPMLNVFGQEVSKTPGPMNLPFSSRFVTMQKTGDPVYAFLGENALTVPSYSKQTKIGNDRMTEEQYYTYVQTAGPKIYDAIRSAIPSMRGLTKEKKQDQIDEIAQNIKKQTRAKMR